MYFIQFVSSSKQLHLRQDHQSFLVLLSQIDLILCNPSSARCVL